jgi:hypothetical protein
MNIFDFISQDEIEDLPDDDPQLAFMTFVRIAQRRLGDKVAKHDDGNQSGWEIISDARHGFMNVVIAAAKKYEIEPLASLEVPRISEFGDKIHQQLKADLDHYLTQLVLDNSSRAKRDSVSVPPELKESIRKYTYNLRKLIEKADDIDEALRQDLLRRLSQFEAELDKKRLSLLNVALLAIALLGAPGALWTSADVATKLVTNILRVVGEAKRVEDAQRQLPSPEPPKAITGPRRNEVNAEPMRERMETLPDMNDEVPF